MLAPKAVSPTGLQLADVGRCERAVPRHRAVEQFLHGLLGLRPTRAIGRKAVGRWARTCAEHLAPLESMDDATLASVLYDSCRGLVPGRRANLEPDALARSLACMHVASQRTLGLSPHPVQQVAVCRLLAGELVEMRTGEGKTLVAAMTAALAAAAGWSVHVVSTNDYLASRDALEMAPLFAFFGLGVSHIEACMDASARLQAYRSPVCFVSGKELVFDCLRDDLDPRRRQPARVSTAQRLTQPDSRASETLLPALHFAIVDEADSVLIDEARTPMILSRPSSGLFEPSLLRWAIDAARRLQEGRDFSRIGDKRDIELLPSGLSAAGQPPADAHPVWQGASWRSQVLRQALSALHVYQRDQHYIVVDDKVRIVDEATGRTMPDRSWEQGLHQLIETKEDLPVTEGRETVAQMTFQRFFRRYLAVCGLTGTAREAARELWSVYGLRVCRLPPHRPERRVDLGHRCTANRAQKWALVADAAERAVRRGQPVLVGTRSVGASEAIASELQRRSLECVLLNARQDAEEAATVATAGLPAKITVATNMAGRGTDIRLHPQALAAGGLHVILTEHHESKRVDRQLLGRCARQGEPGSSERLVSADDELFVHMPRWLRQVASSGPWGLRQVALGLLVWRSQRLAEARALRVRMETLRQDRLQHRMIGFTGPLT